MQDDFKKTMLVCGILSLLGYIFGGVASIMWGINRGVFSTILKSIRDWDMINLFDFLEKYTQMLFPMLYGFFIALIFLIAIIYFTNKIIFKNEEPSPILICFAFTFAIGFFFIPGIIFLIALVLFSIFLIWWLAGLINIRFRPITYFFFELVYFIFTKVLEQKVILGSFNQESCFMFFQIIIFFTILPYSFRLFIVGLEKVLSIGSSKLAKKLIRTLSFLSINFFRYMTYTFAFFTYLMSFLWNISGDMYVIKEGLLAFIIIDVVVFGVFTSISNKNKKMVFLNCIELSRYLEAIKNEIIRYNLLQYENCRVRIKRSNAIEDFEKKAKKISDERLMIINEKINRISKDTPYNKKYFSLNFRGLYLEINAIQKMIDNYISS